MSVERPNFESPERARRLPPLLMTIVLLSGLALILPSALRVPQQDPTPVLEYAPVPPNDNNSNDQQGNLSSMSLGSSSSLQNGVRDLPPPPPPGGGPPVKSRCVRDRHTGQLLQTEDPNSPQCVPYFKGDNGGATWMGVTDGEIRVVLYEDKGIYGGTSGGAGGESMYPVGTYDLNKIPREKCPPNTDTSPTECAQIMVRATRALVRYFNDRFQIYDRQVHVWLQVSDRASAQGRTNDASTVIADVKPFAVIDDAVFGGYNENYVGSAAARHAMVFSSQVAAHSSSFYNENAGYAWGFWPDVEHWADMYGSYMCQRVKGTKVLQSGDDSGQRGFNGSPRKYGLLSTDDNGWPGLKHFASVVKQKLRDCGISWVAEQTYPKCCYKIDATDDGTWATKAIGAFQDAGVNTVLYLGGSESHFSTTANTLGFFPEIILAGDLDNDDYSNANLENKTVWKNTRVVTGQLREDVDSLRPGYQAAKEGDPSLDDNAARYAAEIYRDFFQLFTGIQVSGPHLTPQNVDKGFHAVKPKKSVDPLTAACFFDPHDYTCVKDAQVSWWDPNGQREEQSGLGCWRMVEDGTRYLAGTWQEASDDDLFDSTRRPPVPCNGRTGTHRERL